MENPLPQSLHLYRIELPLVPFLIILLLLQTLQIIFLSKKTLTGLYCKHLFAFLYNN
jgi:hypothetical protein